MDASELKQAVCAAVDDIREELLRLSHGIHAKPELAFEEREAAALLSESIRRSGLEIETGAYGLADRIRSGIRIRRRGLRGGSRRVRRAA